MRKYQALLRVVGLVAIGVLSASSTQVAAAVPKELSPIIEYTFDRPIADVVFDEAEMTVGEAVALGMRGLEGRDATDTVGIEYPRVVVTRDIPNPGYEGSLKSLTFYDTNHGLLKEIELGPKAHTFPFVSQRYVGVSHAILGGESKHHETDSTCFWLLDENGKQVIEKEFDGGRGFVVANNGNFVSWVTWGGGGNRLYFYDSGGNLLGEARPPKGEYLSATVAYSPSGRYVAAAFDLYGVLTLYDYRGKVFWSKDLTTECDAISSMAQQLIISPGEEHIHFSVLLTDSGRIDRHYSFCFGTGGREVFRKNGSHLGRFSPDGRYLALFERPPVLGRVGSGGGVSMSYDEYGDQAIELIDLSTGASLWKHTERNAFINSVDVSRGGERVVCAVENGEGPKKFLVFDRGGALVCDLRYASPPSLSTGGSTEGGSVLRIGRAEGLVWLADGDKLELLHACP